MLEYPRAALRYAFAVLVTIVATSPVGQAQTSSGSNRVLSPTTVAYWQQHRNGDGTGSLDFLLLWRGTPGWRYVEPRCDGTDAVGAIVRRSAELFDFLRCDATLPDANQQAMMAFLCAQMRP